MTSNLGSSYLLDGINEDGTINPEAAAKVENELKSHFRPEFINRLDEIIMFKPLTKENISGIIDILINNLNKRIADRDLSISLTDSAKQFIADNGYDPVYGARPLKRYLQKNIETMVAKEILSDKLDAGDHIIVDFENNGLITRIEH